MARMSTRFTSHWLTIILMLVLAGGIMGVFLPQPSTARASAAQPATDSGTHVPVLLLHGLEQYNSANCYTSSSFTPPDDYSRWEGFLQLNAGGGFAGLSWDRSLIHALRYFNGDTGCEDDIGTDPHCNGYSDGYVGTNNEDIRHIACRFYWYVYNKYTSQGQPVNILAHSMGGIIAKWALSEAAQHNTAQFPYPLLVYNVVTLSTPFQGVPENIFGQLQQVSARLACPDTPDPYNNSNVCFESLQLEYDAGTPSNTPYSIIPQVNAFSSTLGYWTVIGSFGTLPGILAQLGPLLGALAQVTCDFVNVSWNIVTPTATTVTPGPSLASAAVVYYDQCIFHEEEESGSTLPKSASYQDDPSTYKDYSGYQGTVSNWGSYQIRSLPHPLAKAIEALGVTRGPDNLPYPVVDVPGGGNFLDDWFQLGGVNSVLGLPIDSWYSIPGGQRQDFVGGSIYWSTATGTDEVQGAIYYEYTGVTSGPNGSLGFPSSDELGIAGGRVSYFYGHLCGARGPSNSGSAIYWTSTTGAHSVDGCIYNKYWNFGGPNSGLNFPTSDEQTLSGGWVSYFYGYRCGGVANGPDNSGSAIYSSGGRTFDVTGCIYGKYQQLSGPGGMLGYPVSDLTNLYNSSGGFTGWVSYFAGLVCGGGGPNGSGSAIYTPTTSNTLGASHDVTGCIYAKYQQLGETGSLLGYPVSDLTNLYNSSGSFTGWVSYFAGQHCGSGGPDGSGSAIYTPTTSNTVGASHEVHGCIYDAYQKAGGPTGGLGFPVSDEYTNGSGYRESDFQGGYITWNGQANVHFYGCTHCS